jgi:hypothetical protein
MTKARAALPFRFLTAEDEQQVPPLYFAPVPRQAGTGGMTKGRVALSFRFSTMDEEQVVEKVRAAR